MVSSRQSESKGGKDVPPLAVYHICCICKRPRSERYHRQHPIPIDGLPPPGGICRRCRVVDMEDQKHPTDIVEDGRSNDIRIGVSSFVPEEDIVTVGDVRRRRAERIIGDAEWLELERTGATRCGVDLDARHCDADLIAPIKTREGVVYRHVRLPDLPQLPQPPAGFCVIKTREGVTYTEVHEPPPAPALPCSPPKTDQGHRNAGGQIRGVTIPPPPPPEEERAEVVTMATRNQAGAYNNRASITHPPSDTVSKSGSSRTTYTESEIRKLARKEVEKSESEIRRLAREEVEKYRQAERKIEAHKDPYAHGRMIEVQRVPIERRIEQEKDVAAELPWASSKTVPRKDSAMVPIGDASSSDDWHAQVLQQNHVYVPWGMQQAPPSVCSTASLPSTAVSDKTQKPADDRIHYVYRQPQGRGQPGLCSKTERVPAMNVEKLPKRVEELHREYSRQDRSQSEPRVTQAVVYQQHRVDDKIDRAPRSDVEVKAAHAKVEKRTAAESRSRDPVLSPDREYEYRRRVITPVLQPREAAPLYEETNEYYSCRNVPQSPGDAEVSARSRVESIRRRISDASSRVHFSKKLGTSSPCVHDEMGIVLTSHRHITHST